MGFDRVRRLGTLMVAATAIVVGDAEQASAQTLDISGAWALEVTIDGGVSTPSLTLDQAGESLTGHYSSEALGEHDVTGTVSGSEVRISFSADFQGFPISVIYRGTVDDDGVISGTIDIADGFSTGTFTATRTDG